MSTRRSLLIVGIVLVAVAGTVLAATMAASPAVLGINDYAFLGWLLAPLLVTAVTLSVGLTSALMAFLIPAKFCSECGRTIDVDSKFCKFCGHKYALERTATP